MFLFCLRWGNSPQQPQASHFFPCSKQYSIAKISLFNGGSIPCGSWDGRITRMYQCWASATPEWLKNCFGQKHPKQYPKSWTPCVETTTADSGLVSDSAARHPININDHKHYIHWIGFRQNLQEPTFYPIHSHSIWASWKKKRKTLNHSIEDHKHGMKHTFDHYQHLYGSIWGFPKIGIALVLTHF